MRPAEVDQFFEEREEALLPLVERPIVPANLIILAIGVVVALPTVTGFITHA